MKFLMILLFGNLFLSSIMHAQEAPPYIYSIYQNLSLGEPNESVHKDYYINQGSQGGLKSGMILKVFRKVTTYNHSKFEHIVNFPIALIKIIYVNSNTSIARLEKMLSDTEVPNFSPQAVMIGDEVQYEL